MSCRKVSFMCRPLLFCASISVGTTGRKISTYIRAYILFGLKCGPVAVSCKDCTEPSGVHKPLDNSASQAQYNRVNSIAPGKNGVQYNTHSWKLSAVRVNTVTSHQATLTPPGQLTYQIQTNAVVFKESKWRLHIPLVTHYTQHVTDTILLLSRNNCHYESERSFRVRTPWSHAPGLAGKSATMTWKAYPTAAKDDYH